MAVQEGKHTAKITNYTITKNKNGNPQLEVTFLVQDQGTIRWTGYFSELARPALFRALANMGFSGSGGDIARLAQGTETGLLDTKRDLEIVCEDEVYRKISLNIATGIARLFPSFSLPSKRNKYV